MGKKLISWADAQNGADIPVGACVVLRDFSGLVPEGAKAEPGVPGEDGKWGLRSYMLQDGTAGQMLYVNYKTADVSHFTDRGMPPVLEIQLPFSGRYAIWAAFPFIEGSCGGIDFDLDDGGFFCVSAEFGARRGRVMAESGREYWMFCKNAELCGSTLKLRVPFGTYSTITLGLVRAFLSALRFERLPDGGSLAPVDGKADKAVVMIQDGFSGYACWGLPGECWDLRLNRAYGGSDVNIYMLQLMGPTLWKSKVNSYWGEGMTEAEYAGKRAADVRSVKYMEYTVNHGKEGIRLQTEACHSQGAQFHLSFRANLYFASESKYMAGSDYVNGRWWHEHPQCRLPGSMQLDYAKEEVQNFYLSVFREALELFDIDGINLDLTRWPKVFYPEHGHTPELLLGFCRKMRALADEFSEKKGRYIQVSLTMVDYFHAHCSLAEQAIDFEALVRSGTLDFINLQALRHGEYAHIAKSAGVKLYGVLEQTSPYYLHGDVADPLFPLPDGTLVDDSCAGEEFKEPPVGSVPAPFEQYRQAALMYEDGLDGVAFSNKFMGTLHYRDFGHSQEVMRRAEDFTVFGQSPGDYIYMDF